MRQQPDERWNGYPKNRGEQDEIIIIFFRFDGILFILGGWIEKQSQDDWNREKKWVNGIKVRGEQILETIGFRPCIQMAGLFIDEEDVNWEGNYPRCDFRGSLYRSIATLPH